MVSCHLKIEYSCWQKSFFKRPQKEQEKKKTFWMKINCNRILTKSCEVPRASMTTLCVREMCTPSSLWIPQHSRHIITPRLVDSHSGSDTQVCMGIRNRYVWVSGIAAEVWIINYSHKHGYIHTHTQTYIQHNTHTVSSTYLAVQTYKQRD